MSRATRTSVMLLAVFVVTGVGAPLWSAWFTGFDPEELHPAVALAPPGTRDVPQAHPSYDGQPEGFSLLDLDGDGWIACRREPAKGPGVPLLPWLKKRWPVVHDEIVAAIEEDEERGVPVRDTLRLLTGPLVCPELDTLQKRWRSTYRDLLATQDGSDESRPDGVLQPAELTGRDVDFAQLDLDSDGQVRNEELLLATRHLRVDPEDLLANHDDDHDLRISLDEFPGLPELRPFLLGTDALGRDVLTRLLYGARSSLFVGVVATLIALLIGTGYGALAGYSGQLGDELMMRFVDVLYALPAPLLAILALVVLGTGVTKLALLLGLLGWMTIARVVRSQVRSLRDASFIEAAESYGASRLRIAGHLVRNAAGPVIAYATLLVPAMILDEAFLSFLGLGVPTDMASWGSLIADGADQIAVQPWLVAAPSVALALTLVAVHHLGENLRRTLAGPLENQ